MQNYTVAYCLRKGDEELVFASEKLACEHLGVAQCTIASCYRSNSKCKGYSIERMGYTTHHATKTRLYKIWEGMRDRCRRASHKHYKSYGGRGITVCEAWEDFKSFAEWAVTHGYENTLTLDRIDNNGNYEPSNCRWATTKEQAANKRNNRHVYVDGKTMILSECAEKYAIPKSTIRWRIAHNRDILTGAKMDKEDE